MYIPCTTRTPFSISLTDKHFLDPFSLAFTSFYYAYSIQFGMTILQAKTTNGASFAMREL